jgi:thymidylate synthase
VNDFADFVAHVLVVDNQYTYVDGIDQIQNLINELKTNPDSRRLMVNSWNLSELQDMVLPPCHYSFQVYTRELSYNERYEIHRKYITEDKLDLVLEFATNENLDKLGVPTRTISLMWNQRSIDTFLGLPFNIASYGLLLEIIAYELGMVPDELIGNLGDTHLYLNHIEQAKEQISRQPYSLPTLSFTDEVNYMMDTNLDYPGNSLSFSDKIEQFRPDMFIVQDYQSYPAIKAPLSN